MVQLNDNYLKLKAGYLFPEIARRLIRCGIGDVTEPLPPDVIAAMPRATYRCFNRGSISSLTF